VNEGSVTSVAFSSDGKIIAAGLEVLNGSYIVGGLMLWDAANRKRLVDTPIPVKESNVTGVAFSPDRAIIAAGLGYNGLVLWDVAKHHRLTEHPLPVREGELRSVTFSPDGKIIAAGFGDRDRRGRVGGVVLWDAAARQRLVHEPLSVSEGRVWSVAFSPDGKTILAGFYAGPDAGGVVLWDVAGRKRLVDKPLPTEGGVRSVAFSPDGKTLAAGCYDRGGVVLWDVAGRRRLVDDPLLMKDGGVHVHIVSFSRDGAIIAAGLSGGVVLWDVAGHNRLVDEPLPVKEGELTSVTLSPDGKTIATGYGNDDRKGGVVLLDVDLESWQRRAGRIANRNFTRVEWREYFPDTPYHATFPDLPVPPQVTPK
jgi:WD40 repeat protein